MSSARMEIGASGPVFLGNTNPAPVGQYYAIQAGSTGCTISATTPVQSPSWAGATLAPGSVLMFGLLQITTLTLSAGTAFLYRR